jgi:ferredoxin-type protein NapH
MKKILDLYKKYAYTLFFTFILLGMIDLRFALAAIICMVLPIVFALFGKGRYWCGNFCPRGNFYDNVMKKIVKPKRKAPKLISSVWFRVLVIIYLIANFTIGLMQTWGDFYGMGMVFYRIIVITSVVGIILSPIYGHRTWCKFCPMGSLASFIARIRKTNGMVVASSCVSCGLCNKSCPMDIDVKSYKGEVVTHPDCISCGICEYKCPTKAINYEVSIMDNSSSKFSN